jgi:hypothetical protein
MEYVEEVDSVEDLVDLEGALDRVEPEDLDLKQGKCMKPLAINVESSAASPLDLREISLCTAMIVLREMDLRILANFHEEKREALVVLVAASPKSSLSNLTRNLIRS